MSTHERDIALMEAHMKSSADDYFSARWEELDTRLKRALFYAGFQRGWLAQKNEAERLRAAPAPEAARRYDIYLSGPMVVEEEFNFSAFHAEAERLRALGYTVFNQVEIPSYPNAEWKFRMRTDLKALLDSKSIALLPGWEQCTGALLETQIAHRVGIKILQAKEIAA